MKRISMIIAIVAVVTGVSAYAILGDAISGAANAARSAAGSVAQTPGRLFNREGRPGNFKVEQAAVRQPAARIARPEGMQRVGVVEAQPRAAANMDAGRRPFGANNPNSAVNVLSGKNKAGAFSGPAPKPFGLNK